MPPQLDKWALLDSVHHLPEEEQEAFFRELFTALSSRDERHHTHYVDVLHELLTSSIRSDGAETHRRRAERAAAIDALDGALEGQIPLSDEEIERLLQEGRHEKYGRV